MMFRRIYWVTEEVDPEGRSEVTGVYTSVPDLVDRGVGLRPEAARGASFRLSLAQLDVPGVLGRWQSPDFQGLKDALDQYLATGEMNQHDQEALLAALDQFSLARVQG